MRDFTIKAAASERRVDTGLITLCTILAVALRCFFAFRSGLWRDEALFLGIVRFPEISDILIFLRHHESHPPLFYLLMRGWLRLTGGSDTAALLLPVLLGAGIVPALYFCGSRIFGRTTGLLSAFLGAISGTLVENSGLVRPYSLLPLLTLFSVFFLWRMLYDSTLVGNKKGRRFVWAAYLTVTAAMLYTHNWSWLVVGAEWGIVVLSLVLQRLSPGMRWGVTAKQGVQEWVVIQAALFFVYAPWLPTLLFQAMHAGHGAGQYVSFLKTFEQFVTIAVPLPYNLATLACMGCIVTFILKTIVDTHRTSRTTSVKTTSVSSSPSVSGSACCVGVALISVTLALVLNTRNLLLLPRCLAMLSPICLLAFAALVGTIPGRPAVRLCITFTLTTGFLFMTLILLGQAKSNTRELAMMLSKAAQPDDLIVISPEQLACSFNHYYHGDNEQINFPELRKQTVVTFDNWVQRVGRREALEETFSLLTEARQQRRRVWLIVLNGSYDLNLPEDDAKLPPQMLHSTSVGGVRTSQIMARLNRLYGKPLGVYMPQAPSSSGSTGDGAEADEMEVALLFDPSPQIPKER